MRWVVEVTRPDGSAVVTERRRLRWFAERRADVLQILADVLGAYHVQVHVHPEATG